MLRAVFLGVLIAVMAQADEPKSANPPARFSITWITNSPHRVVVQGQGLKSAIGNTPELQKTLQVHVEQPDLRSGLGLPPVIGRYEINHGALTFHPQFPFQPGVRYRATFQLKGAKPLSSTFEIPLRARDPNTVVMQIYPTADVLPQNLLKLYLHFSAPMSGGGIYEHIQLTDQIGKPVELPFLEIDEELWNSDMTRLTLFLDPGRIKQGVKPLEEVGPALEAGKRYTLTISRAWADATGTPLKQDFQKSFRVTADDREPPDPEKWKISSPKAGTREPLKIHFPDSMDHALALRMISLDGIAGTKSLLDHEREWIFTPDQPWSSGRHRIVVQTTIEDLAGNNIGKPFEVDLFEGVQKKISRETVDRIFEVK